MSPKWKNVKDLWTELAIYIILIKMDSYNSLVKDASEA